MNCKISLFSWFDTRRRIDVTVKMSHRHRSRKKKNNIWHWMNTQGRLDLCKESTGRCTVMYWIHCRIHRRRRRLRHPRSERRSVVDVYVTKGQDQDFYETSKDFNWPFEIDNRKRDRGGTVGQEHEHYSRSRCDRPPNINRCCRRFAVDFLSN